jgi:hypothetical protein
MFSWLVPPPVFATVSDAKVPSDDGLRYASKPERAGRFPCGSSDVAADVFAATEWS